jgi:hypothetical protein
MTTPSLIPQELVEQLERGNVIPFLGHEIALGDAGEAGLPSQSQLAEELARRSSFTDADQTFSRIAQQYEMEQGRNALLSLLRERLLDPARQPLKSHRLLVNLPCRVIITTCLDDILERALYDARRPYNSVAGDVDVAYEDQSKLLLVRMYGSLDQPGSVVVTEMDHLRWQEEVEAVFNLLKGLIASRTLLFLGHDLDDDHLKNIYARVMLPFKRNVRRSYACCVQASPYVVAWWDKLNVQTIFAEPTMLLQQLTELLQTRRARPAFPPILPGPLPEIPRQPYKFLNSYEESDQAVFFGREQEKWQVLSKIATFRVVLLHGKSGTGKTSLIRAGLMPELRERGYQVVYVRILTDSIEAIKSSINATLSTPIPKEESLDAFLKRALATTEGTWIIFLDQFEELFTPQVDSSYRSEFLRVLCEVYADTTLDLKIVIGIREDYLAELSTLKPHIPEIFFNAYRLEPLGAEQARQAIIGPVVLYGIRYEEGLADRILSDLGGETVDPPQLQIVCDRLYERLSLQEKVITYENYAQLGGARAILAGYLDDVLRQYPDAERAKFRVLLKEFVTSGEQPAVPTAEVLTRCTGLPLAEVERLLEELRQARLIRRREAEPLFELVHEYLIPCIASWTTEEERARKRAQEMLEQGLTRWHHFHLPLYSDELAIINEQRQNLRISEEARQLLTHSAVWTGYAPEHWLMQASPELRSEALQAALEDPEPARRRRAAALVGYFAATHLVSHLRRLVEEDPTPTVRQEAIHSLVQMEGEKVVPWLGAMLGGVPQQQRRALEAMDEIQRATSLDLVRTPQLSRLRLRWRLGWLRWQRNRRLWSLTTRYVAWGGAVGGVLGGVLGVLLHNSLDQMVMAVAQAMLFGIFGGSGVGFGFGTILAIEEPRRSLLYVVGAALGGAATGLLGGLADLQPSRIVWGVPIGVMSGAGSGATMALLINLSRHMAPRPRLVFRLIIGTALGMATAGLLLGLGARVGVVPVGPLYGVSVGALTATGGAGGLELAERRLARGGETG